MSKNKYTSSALKEATSIVDKFVRKKSKKFQFTKFLVLSFLGLSVFILLILTIL